jgi:anti-sigma regulatory factor (Ser/Thr protein kinase)
MAVGNRACTLAVRLPGEPASVPRARHLVRDYLIRERYDPAEHPGILLSVSEACTNAVIHAYPWGGGDLDLGARIQGSRLCVTVRDFGVGPQEPTRRPGQGYGMLLIKAHVVDLDVRTCDPGTEITMTFDLSVG